MKCFNDCNFVFMRIHNIDRVLVYYRDVLSVTLYRDISGYSNSRSRVSTTRYHLYVILSNKFLQCIIALINDLVEMIDKHAFVKQTNLYAYYILS